MDVICERCKAEYEFDEALLGEKGTTVKCSACGHVFRVLPPHRDLARSHLKLRYAKDGSVKSLSSLRELQQRIRAGEVSFDDELGRDGFPFRPLREVPELKNFFATQSERPPSARAPRPGLERTTVKPDESRLAGFGDKTVEGRLPGSPGATVAGRAESPLGFAPHSTRPPPPLPSERARAALEAERQAALRGQVAVREPTGQHGVQREPTGSYAIPAGTQRPPTGQHVVPGASRPPTGQHALPGASRPPIGQHALPGSAFPEPKLPPELRPRSFKTQTMMGVGPEDLQLPPPPRMPSFGPEATRPGQPSGFGPEATRPAQPSTASAAQPSAPSTVGTPHGTLHGAPTPQFALGVSAPASPHKPVHASASYERGGTLSPLNGAAAQPASAESAEESEEEESEAELVEPDEVAEVGFGSSDALLARLQTSDSLAPVLDVPDPSRKLYLDASEQPPARVEGGSSKLWLWGALLLLLGGGTWYGLDYLEQPKFAPLDGPEFAAPEPAALADASLPAAEALAAANAVDALDDTTQLGTDAAGGPPAPTEEGDPSDYYRATHAEPMKPVERAPEVPVAALPAPAIVRDAAAAAQAVPVAAKPNTKQVTAPAAAAAASAKSQLSPKPATPAGGAPGPAPQDYGAWVTRGDQLDARGDHEGAQKAFRSALAMRPAGSEANAGLGFALLSTGKAREALPYFDAAASSGYADANIGLGDAYRKLGQPSSALEAYNAYLERLTKGARADYARAQIEKLRSGSSESKPSPATSTGEPDKAAPSKSDYQPAGELTQPGAGRPPTVKPRETP